MSHYEPPVDVRTLTYTAPGTVIQYPQVTGLASRQAEEKINRAIILQIQEMQRIQQGVQTGTHPETTGHFEIKTNERGILSLLLSNYTYSIPMAHGYTVAKALTFSIRTGQSYALSDLFRPGSGYESVLTAEINRQIKERSIPVLEGSPVTVQPNQDFYLADKSLVIFYPLYAITPYYVGFPMFPISVYTLQGMAAETGPLMILAADVV
ncbi:DUF3298 and DUF4163 domain-containing protein [Paenibacillus sp. DMB20]|uniref:DUF3298 and DUF4163 domain-containing protein n=1 Tax=Paenibacillus sp. DMB20 TaxID=1642570 RepID=UPI00062770B5|nr:DUF3298 and DUF4163 domain-containing protein [Paenibacillus sp. DMB20]KKO54087.1 hypothetical protein XI25_08345 [Paenibacillus sp. DMB20]